MKDWLSTRDVALLLKVSEASVRRWSDAGILPVERVGRRGERRFREADARRFLEHGMQSELAPTSLPKPRVGTVGGVALALGSHVATFYDTDAARFRLTVPFLADGLRQGQGCLLVAPEELGDAYVAEIGAQEGVDLDAAVSSGLFAIVAGVGKTADEASARLQELAWKALERSPGVVRVVGEMTHARASDLAPSDMLRYEEIVNSAIKRLPAVIVCQYDARAFDGATILGAIKTHPDTFEMNLGRLIV